MAQVVSIPRLAALLDSAERRGARFAWIEAQTLLLGAELGVPAFVVDLGAETLTRSDVDPSGSTRDAAPSPDRRDVAAQTAPARSSAPPTAVGEAHAAIPDQFELPAFGARRTGAYRLTLEGKSFAARSQKEALLLGLSAIERARPGTLAKLEQDKTRTKRAVSRRREALNDDPRLAERFSQQIEGGWWAFTNNSYPETQKFVRRAAFHAGLHVRIEKLA